MKYLVTLLFVSLSGCAIVPDSIRPEVSHQSHMTQHWPIASHDTHYGSNMAELVAHWDVKKIAYLEIGEGISLDKKVGLTVQGDPIYGEIEGPREQFVARVGLVIPIK